MRGKSIMVKDSKVKGLTLYGDLNAKVTAWAKSQQEKLGYATETDFWNEYMGDLIEKEFVTNNEAIPANLKKHFESDLNTLQSALNSIRLTFIGQMERQSVERDSLEKKYSGLLKDKDDKFAELKGKLDDLTTSFNELKKRDEQSLKELENQKKIIDEFEGIKNDKNKRILELETSLEKASEENKTERDLLNAQIARLHNDLTDYNKLIKEKSEVDNKVFQLETEKKNLSGEISSINEKHKSELASVVAKMELEKDKEVIENEKTVRSELNSTLEKYREENQKLYGTVDSLRNDKEDMRARLQEQLEKAKEQTEEMKKQFELERSQLEEKIKKLEQQSKK